MGRHLHEPARDATEPKAALLDYLDYYRSVVAAKLDGLTDEQLDEPQFHSGWTPRQLIKHLVYMERRWLRWGFVAEQVRDPLGDWDEAQDRWHTGPDDTRDALLTALAEGGAWTRMIVEQTDLADNGAVGGRFTSPPTPTLLWILLHVFQEYARHAGHLDIAREELDGAVGE